MKKIVVFDPTVVTDNLGDFIILDSIRSHLHSLFPDDFFYTVPTHERISSISRRIVADSAYKFVAGTNMLSSHFWWYRQWKIDCILFGIGWHKYQSKPDPASAFIYKKVLHNTLAHSVRDKYTEKQLNSIGLDNVIYTGCPTMWRLTPDHIHAIPRSRARAAVVTVTEYLRDESIDKAWVDVVLEQYEEVYFWTQTFNDLAYAKELFGSRLKVISPTLSAYDEFLDTHDVDYIGTRLHGGVRALQKKRRTMILQVDNRAREIARDTGLPSLPREDASELLSWINGNGTLEIIMPWDNIQKWKNQFV